MSLGSNSNTINRFIEYIYRDYYQRDSLWCQILRGIFPKSINWNDSWVNASGILKQKINHYNDKSNTKTVSLISLWAATVVTLLL